MSNKDRNFDGLGRRFRDNIYRRPKGQLRLELCWRELTAQLPQLEGAPLRVWDAGGGLGQMSLRLAALGHEVLYSDLSQEMLAAFLDEHAAAADRCGIQARQGAIQEMALQPEMVGRFDLIVCHAVLEWVADQPALLRSLARCLRPDGRLSLMFYNLNTLVLSNITKGNLYKLRDEDFAGHPGGLTPSFPCRPHQVEAWLNECELDVVARRGIRLVYDLMPRAIRDARSLEDVSAIEWQYGDQEPFWALGRYVHLLCRPHDNPDRSVS